VAKLDTFQVLVGLSQNVVIFARNLDTLREHVRQIRTQDSIQTVPQPEQEYPLLTLSASRAAPIVVSVNVNGSQVDMEVDTGSAISLVSEETYRSAGLTVNYRSLM